MGKRCPKCEGVGTVSRNGKWWNPGPLAEARLLGRWPRLATNTVWSDALWMYVTSLIQSLRPDVQAEIGCDPARFGDDFTAIHVRRGTVSLRHESHNGWDAKRVSGRLKQLCREYAGVAALPEEIAVKVDVDGPCGMAVYDLRDDFHFVPVSAAADALDKENYHNRRSELWFNARDQADEGLLSLAKIAAENPEAMTLLKSQAMAPTWSLSAGGRIELEKKEKTKERLVRSPDDMDALNLAYYSAAVFDAPDTVPEKRNRALQRTRRDRDDGDDYGGGRQSAADRRGLYGIKD